MTTTFSFVIQNQKPDEIETKKKKTKKEILEEKLKDLENSDEIFQKYTDYKDQVMMVDLIGRVIWMNDLFKRVNLKTENDLLESLFSEYGFEIYNEGLEYVLKNFPETHEENTIIFVSIQII